MPKFEDTLKKLAVQIQNKGSPKITEELVTVQGLLALLVDIQLREQAKKSETKIDDKCKL
jgi:hypothetical protein